MYSLQRFAFLLFVCRTVPIGSSAITESCNIETITITVTEPTPIVAIPLDYVTFPDDHAAYKIHEELATWEEARDRCISEYARLAITDTREKIQHINSLRQKSEPWLRVGIHNFPSANQWIRVDTDLPATKIPWGSDKPAGFGSCAGIAVGGNALLDYPCNDRKEYFVCEIPISKSDLENETSTSTGSATLPVGYVMFSDVYAAYKIHKELATWNEARELCRSEGARLAITDSTEKIVHINSLKTNWGREWLHVGIYNLASANEWVRVDDGLVVTSIPWESDKPGGTGSCAGIPLGVDGLRDHPCGDWKEYFVCEIPI